MRKTLTLLLIASCFTAAGDSYGLALMWWDKDKGFQGLWCENHNPYGCAIGRDVDGRFKWDGKQQVVDNEFHRNGKTFRWHKVLTDITSNSFVQTADIGEKGGPLKRWLTIHATRLGVATAQAPEPAKAIFIPARDITATLQNARPEAPGVTVARVTEGPNYDVLLVRRTAPGLAEVDRGWSEIWYVIGGTGVLETGGSLAGHAIVRGEAYRIAKGDVITIPAGVPQWVSSMDGNGVDYMLVKFHAARDTDAARNDTRIWFYSAAQIDSAAHNAPESRLTPGNYGVPLDGDAGYDNGLNRRTAPGTAHADKGWSEVWYVITGTGVQVTGGTLVNPRPGHTGELRSTAISEGEERRIAPGDMIIVPAGVPHWVRSIDGKGITYFSLKIASPK